MVVESRDGGGMKGGDKVEVDLVFCIVFWFLTTDNRLLPASTQFIRDFYSGLATFPLITGAEKIGNCIIHIITKYYYSQ